MLKNKLLTALLLPACLLAALTGCGGDPAPEDTTGEVTTAPTTAPTTTAPTTTAPTTTVPPEPDGPFSLFTGLPVSEELYQKRPASFMINNSKKAIPHRGLGGADLYFEIAIEGEFNRIMAVFQDYDNVDELGSVRSARDYFVDYAMGMDCIYVHLGGSPQGYIALKTRGVDWLDGITGRVENLMFHRDKARRKNNGYEHSAFARPNDLYKAIENFDYRDTVDPKLEPMFNFSDKPAAGTLDASVVHARYSYYIEPVFTYDAATGLYLREEFGKPHIDELTGDQLAVKNIFYVFTGHRSAGDGSDRITVDTIGTGDGLYVVNGKATAVKWAKDSYTDRLRFLVNGAEVAVSPGKSWIMVLPTSQKDKVLGPAAE